MDLWYALVAYDVTAPIQERQFAQPKEQEMTPERSRPRIWKVKCLTSSYRWEGELVAEWEVALAPISDEYSPDDTSAEELFHIWTGRVRETYPNGLIPILWSVVCWAEGKYDFMPFQFSTLELRETFLSSYTWPVDKETGERLNWLELPVADKQWNMRQADKGGFIQEYTGWKPAILQPYVYLPSLLQSGRP